MAADWEKIKTQIENLINNANTVTGESNTNLTDSINTLIQCFLNNNLILNIAYGNTEPENTNVLWCKCNEPTEVLFSPKLEQTLPQSKLLIHSSTENIFKLIESPVVLEIGVIGVYYGDNNNLAQPVDAYLYFNGEWVCVSKWSDTATNSISNTGVVSKTSGNSYLYERLNVLNNSIIVTLKNINNGSFIQKTIAFYKEDGTFISMSNDNGDTCDTVLLIPATTCYISATANSNGLATNNDPNNQLRFVFDDNYQPTWSTTATYGINNSTGALKASGDAYLSSSIIVPENVTQVTVSNINNGTYTWKEMYAYDCNNNYLGKAYTSGGNSGTSASTIKKSEYPKMKYIKITAFPNKTSANNNPGNQLRITFN